MGDLENRVDTAVDNALTQAGVQSDDAGSSNLLDLASSARSALTKIGEQVNERSEALSEDPRYAAEKAESEHRRSAIDSAFAKVEEVDKVDQSWRNTKSGREYLVECYGADAVRKMTNAYKYIEAELQADPAAAAEKLARHYLTVTPLDRRGAKKADVPNADDRSISACIDRAEAELTDRDAKASLKDVLAEHGPNFDLLLNRLVEADKQLRADPMGAAGRIAASFGMPVTPEHQAAVEQQQQMAQANAQMAEGFQRVIDSGLMPGFERPEIQDAVADVLSDPAFQRTGDNGRDLWNAYQTALRVQEAARNEQLKQRSAQRAKLSVGSSGTPAESGRSEAPSTRQALDRAFASMGM